MVVYTEFQSIQKRRFAMVAAAHDQGNAARDSHAGDFSLMRKSHGDTQRFRGDKRDGIFHWPGRNPAFSRKNGAVSDKGDKISDRELVSDTALILSKKNSIFQFFMVCIFVEKGLLYTDRKKIKENLFQFSGVDRSSICRKSDKETGDDFFFCDLTGGTFENFLSAVTDGDQATFARAFCTEGIVDDLFFKLSGEIVGKGHAGDGIFIIFFRKTGCFVRNPDTDVRGRGKRVSLYMVNGENIIIELIAAFQSFVGRVAFFVDRM